MECYEGATMIKTFRGLMADNAIDTIVLHTNDGSTGYRIVKFELMFTDVATSTKSIVQIWKTPPTAGVNLYSTIDFSDQKLLAVAIMSGKADQTAYPEDLVVTFDRETFNQDIYITHNEVAGAAAINYYLELEQVKLDLGANTVATLKDIRNNKTQGF
jgi:hypothetical protein